MRVNAREPVGPPRASLIRTAADRRIWNRYSPITNPFSRSIDIASRRNVRRHARFDRSPRRSIFPQRIAAPIYLIWFEVSLSAGSFVFPIPLQLPVSHSRFSSISVTYISPARSCSILQIARKSLSDAGVPPGLAPILRGAHLLPRAWRTLSSVTSSDTRFR